MSAPEAARATDAGAFRLVAASSGGMNAQGPLTFASARRACELGIETIARAPAGMLEIDCRGITLTDSAGLAVLLEWLGVARRVGRSLRYTHLPEGLAGLAAISDLQELLERGV
jgi:phospholipid transport system transporter-binding protein